MDYEYYEQSVADETREALAYDPVISDDEFYGAWDSFQDAQYEEDFADFLYEQYAGK